MTNEATRGVRLVTDDQSEIVRFDCGHQQPATFNLTLDDKPIDPLGDNPRLKCGHCHLEYLQRTVIRCAKCGEPVLAGEFVRLWLNEDLTESPFKPLGRRVLMPADRYVGERLGFIGCMELNCCRDGCSFCGIWDGDQIIGIGTEKPVGTVQPPDPDQQPRT